MPITSVGCPKSRAVAGLNYTTGGANSVTVSGGTAPYLYEISAGSLPTGLTLNSSSGEVTGTPTVANTFAYTAKVTDSLASTLTTPCSIEVIAEGLSIDDLIAIGTIGTAFSETVQTSGGFAPLTFLLFGGGGPLPDGLTLDTATGEISGVPTAVGVFPFVIWAYDASYPYTDPIVVANCIITINNSVDLVPDEEFYLRRFLGDLAGAPTGDSGVGELLDLQTDNFVGDDSTTDFTLTKTPNSFSTPYVTVDGAPVSNPTEVSISGTTVSFADPPALDAAIKVVYVYTAPD